MTFQRESRYIVVKLKDLAPGQEADIREHLTELSAQPVDSLVIERDWPEYEPAWRMIQARVEGATLPPAHIEDERESFEREVLCLAGSGRLQPDLRRSGDEYKDASMQWAFDLWKARAALSAPPAADKLRDAVTALSQHLLLVDQSPIAIELLESVKRTMLAAPTPPASEQQRAVVMPERKPFPDPGRYSSTPDLWPQRCAEVKGWNACVAEFLRLNPHLAKGEGV